MHYEEKIIAGVLHWRSGKNSVWTAKTAEQLTAMLLEARRERKSIMPQPISQPEPVFKPPYVVTC